MRSRTIKIVFAIFLTTFAGLYGYYLIFMRTVLMPTGAMSNTLVPGDRVVVTKRVGEIRRGDVLLFAYPKDPSQVHISRAVGLPGETIEVRDTRIYINGKELPEERVTVEPEASGSYAALEELSTESKGTYRVFYHSRNPGNEPPFSSGPGDEGYGIQTPFKIPDHQYFVMSDNRDNSYDSRFWGTVSREAIVGKPTMIYWSSHFNQSGVEEVKWKRVFKRIE